MSGNKEDEIKSLIEQANVAKDEEKLLVAARLLRQVQQIQKEGGGDQTIKDLLTPDHYNLLQTATECEEAIADLLIDISSSTPAKENSTVDSTTPEENDDSKETKEGNDNDNGEELEDENENYNEWIQQEEYHGKYRTNVYYKYPPKPPVGTSSGWFSTTSSSNSSIIVCRLEAVIPVSLLIPLLCVLNESSLYTTWVPYWTTFNLGLKLSLQLQQLSTVNQILLLYGNSPWPFSPRVVIIQTTAIDETEGTSSINTNTTTDTTTTTTNNSFICVHLNSLNPDDNHPNITIPDEVTQAEAVTTDFTGTFLFRSCPSTHPLLIKKKKENPIDDNEDNENETENIDKEPAEDEKTDDDSPKEPMLLVSFKMSCDPHMTGIPQRIINYVLRKGLGQIWGSLLKVAEEVKNGTRTLHTDAIKNKPKIYDFIQTRCNYMVSKLIQQEQEEQQQQEKDLAAAQQTK